MPGKCEFDLALEDQAVVDEIKDEEEFEAWYANRCLEAEQERREAAKKKAEHSKWVRKASRQSPLVRSMYSTR